MFTHTVISTTCVFIYTQVVGNQLVTGLSVEDIGGVSQVTSVEATDRQTGEL
jgi:hypothetical protein